MGTPGRLWNRGPTGRCSRRDDRHGREVLYRTWPLWPCVQLLTVDVPPACESPPPAPRAAMGNARPACQRGGDLAGRALRAAHRLPGLLRGCAHANARAVAPLTRTVGLPPRLGTPLTRLVDEPGPRPRPASGAGWAGRSTQARGSSRRLNRHRGAIPRGTPNAARRAPRPVPHAPPGPAWSGRATLMPSGW